MEGLGAEVSAKIRSAIKAKLIELEAYVDEELPDYIMVMVANNRNKEQMEEDLGLFLNHNTKAFTNWLHAVLEKLKKVTLDEVSKKDTKKKKVKKVSEKSSSKKTSKDDKKVKSDKKSSKSSKSSDKSKSSSSKNANLEEIGERKRKKTTSQNLDDSGGKDGYDPGSLLKSAVDKTKSKGSPKKSSKKSSKKDAESGETKKSKNIINLREEEDFYRSKSSELDSKRSRGTVSSIVSKVVKPVPRDSRDRYRHRSRSRSRDDYGYDPERAFKRSLASRAQVPPRPSRPSGRDERGVARVMSRAMLEADRSLGRGRREERDVRRYPSPPAAYRDRSRDKYMENVPKLSAEDIKRYEFLQRRREEREHKELRQRERDLRDRQKEEQVRINRRKMKDHEENDMRYEQEEIRVVVTRDPDEMEDISPENSPPSSPAKSSPPKKRKLEDDDAELLEMRRKALESLMKRTDKELLKTKVDSDERKVVEKVSDDSDSDSDSDTSLSDVDTSKDTEPEPTFIVTMDGIDDDYFKGGSAKPPIETKTKKMKNHIQRKAASYADSKASSDAELELHADVSFDEIPKEKPQQSKSEATEKPTMKVAARKRSPILAPTNGESQPVAAVKPLQADNKPAAKPGSAAKLAASYAAKLTQIKAAKAKAAKKKPAAETSESNKASEEKTDTYSNATEVVKVADKKTPVTAPEKVAVKKTLVTAPEKVAAKKTPITAPEKAPVKPKTPVKITPPAPNSKPASTQPKAENKKLTATKRKPITAPSPERTASAMTGVSKLSYPDTGVATAFGSKYKWKATNNSTAFVNNKPSFAVNNGSKYKWKAANKIEY